MLNKTWLFASSSPESELALVQWMLECCQQQALKLTVVVVLPKLSHNIFEWFETQQHQDVLQQQTDFETAKRQSWIDLAAKKQVDLNIVVRFGKVFYEVIQVAKEQNVELVIKQTEDFEQKENLIFQSADWHLLRKSPVPLLLHRRTTPLPFKTVMASLDIDIEATPVQASAFNQALLTWAQFFKGPKPIKVVHAWQSDVDSLVKHWNADLPDAELIKLNEQLYHEHKQALNLELSAFAPQSQNQAPTVLLCKGEAASSVAAAVVEQEVDLLVLGTVGRSGLLGMLIGNTAEDLLEKVNCSVLAMKPKTLKN